MAFNKEGTSRSRGSFARRLSSVLMLGASLVAGSTAPVFARGGRGGGAAAHRGGGGAQYSGARAAHPPAARPAAPAARAHPQTAPRAATQGRNVNVNANRRDVNVHHNTVVRPAARPYARAPYAYGGRRYYAHHSYHYHAYRAYGWGPAYHPFGAFVATVAATAVVVSVANQQYRYNQGVWYLPGEGGYSVVTAPVGATVTTLPPNAVVVSQNNYYYGGTYYEKTGGSYKVVAPTAGTVVENLPEGGQEVTVGDQKYVKVGETYYQPIQKDGKDMYEVVEVK